MKTDPRATGQALSTELVIIFLKTECHHFNNENVRVEGCPILLPAFTRKRLCLTLTVPLACWERSNMKKTLQYLEGILMGISKRGLKCYWHLWSEKVTSNLPDLWPARLLSDCSFTDLNWVPLLAPTLEAFLVIFTVAQRGWEFCLILCGSGSGVVSVLTATASSSLSWRQSVLLLYHFVLFVRRWRLALHVNIILYNR